MKTISLNGAWTLEIPASAFGAVPAAVPGSVYHDLLTAGCIEDPFWRDNETEALKLMENDFVYSRRFEVGADLLGCESVILRCEGLDTLAEIRLNGSLAGTAENMHRIWEYDVKSLLREGENDISVRFASPTKYIREAYALSRADGSSDAMVGFPLLRKAHCMFGWDWGPRLPDAGIWRPISLLGIDTARIRDVLILQDHSRAPDAVALTVRTNLEHVGAGEAAVRVRVTGPWPAGFGDQPLYTVTVTLEKDGAELDSSEKRIGLRTMTVTRKKDEWGESFSHCVNGVDIFAMGADYIPEDNLLPRVNPERTRKLLTDARAANMNCVRVWGGGYYPGDAFYDICDELGLLVWQDFMFACAVYNLTDEFEANITAEFVDNVRRLRHHPSLALWCGNNEMEQFVAQGEWVSSKRQAADYIKMYEYVIPNRGDVHYWDVWHGLKPFTDYRNYLFRYVSEFGFQSFPCMETIESFTLPEDRNLFSYVMEKHQRNASANGRIVFYLSQMYLYPREMSELVYASQLLQAQAMQYGVEHWRRHRGHCMGAVIWQLNDCWPVASWASIDYFGRWKALHYYAKRFFAPVLISCHEEGILSQNTNVNAEPFALKKSARLNVSNETRSPFAGTVRWSLRRPDASVIREGSESVSVSALDTLWLDELDFSEEDTYGTYFAYELLDAEGRTVGGGSVLPGPTPEAWRSWPARTRCSRTITST